MLTCKTLTTAFVLSWILSGSCDALNPTPKHSLNPQYIGHTTQNEFGKRRSADASHSTSSLSILAWNIESGGSDTNRIAEQIRHKMPAADIIALQEVPAHDVERLAGYFGRKNGLACNTSNDDRLVLAWSPRFSLVRQVEIGGWQSQVFAPEGHRAPLIAHLRDIKKGAEFLVVKNHLARSNADLRTMQAAILVDWARSQTLPIIAVGDYNMDFDIPSQTGSHAFAEILSEGVFEWVKPRELIDTNWSDGNDDGLDDYPNSILDFVFTARQPLGWDVTAEVVVLPGDFPDDETTSDHRAVLTVIRY